MSPNVSRCLVWTFLTLYKTDIKIPLLIMMNSCDNIIKLAGVPGSEFNT